MNIDTDAMGNAIADELDRQGVTEGFFVLLLKTRHATRSDVADCNIVSSLEAHEIPAAIKAFSPIARRMTHMQTPEGEA